MPNNNNTMKRNPTAGSLKVYWFTLRQMILARGWIIATLVVALLLLIGIPTLLFALSKISDPDKKDDETEIRIVCVVDETEGEADYSVLNLEDESLEYIDCATMDTAISAAAGKKDAVILRVTKPEDSYSLTVYLPQVTEISRSKASSFGTMLEARFRAVLMQKAELTPEGVMLLSMPVVTETAAVSADSQEKDGDSIAVEVLRTMVPFMMIMMIYMMVVLYGQSMANSVMLEKNSKLMETVLTAVHPVALMTGKLFATATAAVLQLLIWLVALIGGTVGGAFFALRMIPDTNNEVVLTVQELSGKAASISIAGVVLSIVIMALGFLLYLSLSAVAGALASKTEDLNKTNAIYALVLVCSLLLCISKPDAAAANAAAGGEVSLVSDAVWLKCFPFTAILVMPADLILGKVPAIITVGSVSTLIGSVILMLIFAAAVYKLLALYRGEPPKLRQLIAMFKENKQKQQENAQNN